jgi:hypothetical protein
MDEYKSAGKQIVQKAASMLDWKSIRIIFLLAAKDVKEFNSKAYKKILERIRNELGLGKERYCLIQSKNACNHPIDGWFNMDTI